MYTANNVADWFISQVDVNTGDTLSHLKLQKLVYYAQAWHFAVFDKVLFDEPILAWKSGPVTLSIHDRLDAAFSHGSISKYDVKLELVDFDENAMLILTDVNILYGERGGPYLTKLVKTEHPWSNARMTLKITSDLSAVISLQDMKTCYSVQLKEAKAENL